MRRGLGIALVSLSIVTTIVASSPPSVVLAGSIEFVESKGKREFASDQAMYVHENLQFIVVTVERAVLGSSPGGKVIIGVSVDDPSLHSVDWLTPSYGVLDPKVWKSGARVVLACTPSPPGPESCAPSAWKFEGNAPRPSGVDPATTTVYRNAELQRYQALPVLCASLRDTFLLRE